MHHHLRSLGAALLLGPLLASPAAGNQPPACSASAHDEASATAMAAACGTRVEVEADRSEFTQAFAEPSGFKTQEISVVPQRAKRRDGSWGAIDTTLQRSGVYLVPAAAASDVRFSTGGDGPFATLTHQGQSFSLSWPGTLPAPTVEGDTATYAGVLPDVDLVVKATDSGFGHLLIVKSKRAAAHPLVRQARYRLGGTAAPQSTSDGGVVVRAGDRTVATAGEAEMWDTPDHPSDKQLAMMGASPQPRKFSRVATGVAAKELLITPDAAMLDDPAARFPLTVDPLWVTGQGQWAYATSTNTNAPTIDEKISSGDPSPAATILRSGDDTTGRINRSFMRFSVSTFKLKQVITAKIAGRVDHTWKCTTNKSNYFYRTAGIGATPRQAWPGPALQLKLGQNSVHANEASCSEPNMPFEVSTSTLISDLQNGANAGWDQYYVGVTAGENTSGLNEGVDDRWMRYFLNDFKLHVTYNTKPNKPDSLTVDGKACVAGADRPVIKTTTPTLRAHVTDPDGDTMQVWFAWAKWNGSSFVDEPGGGSQSGVPNNGTALFNAAGNVNGGIYTFRSQSNDGRLASDVTHMPGNCEWEVDTAPPAAPTVTADIYLEGQTRGAPGKTGRFTFASSNDTKSFLWGFTDPPANALAPQSLGGSVSIDYTPPSSGPRTLFVRAIDRAGNEANKAYQFIVAAESTALARWKMDESPGATTLADDTGNNRTLTVLNGATLGQSGRLVPGNDGAGRTALGFDGVDDRAEANGPVIADTGKSFSVAAWARVSDTTTTHSLVTIDGVNNAVFLLESTSAGLWRFDSTTGDVSPGVYNPPAVSTSPVRPGAWTHLTATYDSAARTVRLYVNGVLESTATGVTMWDADRNLRIGGYGTPFKGSVAEVQVWDRMISASEVFDLSDPIKVGKVAEWRMEEVGPGPAFDASGLAHDLTFWSGAQIPPSGAGQTGTGLRLDGVDDYAAPNEAVIHTDQSFTVSCWVRMSATDRFQTILSQQSSGFYAGFALYYATDNGGEWKIRMHATPDDNANNTWAVSAATTPGSYHHLVAVLDVQKREVRLYVDGVLKMNSPMKPAWQPWDSGGPFLIGRLHYGANPGEFATADVDEVRVYQGAVTDVTRIP